MLNLFNIYSKNTGRTSILLYCCLTSNILCYCFFRWIWIWISGFELSLCTTQIAKWILVVVIVKLYIIRKLRSSFFPKENLIRPNYIFPNHILILFIHCILLSREILHIPKITPPNGKSALQFLKNIFACTRVKTSLRSAYYCKVNSEW